MSELNLITAVIIFSLLALLICLLVIWRNLKTGFITVALDSPLTTNDGKYKIETISREKFKKLMKENLYSVKHTIQHPELAKYVEELGAEKSSGGELPILTLRRQQAVVINTLESDPSWIFDLATFEEKLRIVLITKLS
jgi:hypothetical protein